MRVQAPKAIQRARAEQKNQQTLASCTKTAHGNQSAVQVRGLQAHQVKQAAQAAARCTTQPLRQAEVTAALQQAQTAITARFTAQAAAEQP